jgi:hypothetical protein
MKACEASTTKPGKKPALKKAPDFIHYVTALRLIFLRQAMIFGKSNYCSAIVPYPPP